MKRRYSILYVTVFCLYFFIFSALYYFVKICRQIGTNLFTHTHTYNVLVSKSVLTPKNAYISCFNNLERNQQMRPIRNSFASNTMIIICELNSISTMPERLRLGLNFNAKHKRRYLTCFEQSVEIMRIHSRKYTCATLGFSFSR